MHTRIVHLVSASAIALGLSLAGCDGGDTKTEAKPEEAKPAETKPAEPTPAEPTPAEATPVEATPVEAAPDEATPDEAAPDEAAPDEATPPEVKPEPEEPNPVVTKSKKAKTPAAPKIDGKPLYLSKCKSCHGADGKGKTKFAEKHDVSDLTTSKLSVAKIAKVIKDGVPDTKMKSFSKKLSEDEIQAVATYVKRM